MVFFNENTDSRAKGAVMAYRDVARRKLDTGRVSYILYKLILTVM